MKRLGKLIILAGLSVSLMGATCSEIYTRSGTWYRVQKGDSLSTIAKRFRTRSQTLAEMNNITKPNDLAVGQRIYIPKSQRRSYAKKSSSKKSGADHDTVVVQRGKFNWPVEGVLTSVAAHEDRIIVLRSELEQLDAGQERDSKELAELAKT